MNAARQKAEFLMAQERYSDALRELGAAIAQEPEDADNHSMAALCLSHTGKKREALIAAQRAVGMEPDNPYCHYVLAAVELQSDHPKKAEAAVREAIKIYPYDSGYFALLSASLAHQRRWRLALEAAEHGLALDPDDVSCNNLRAEALSFLGQRQDAQTAARRAIEEDPDSAHSHAQLGWVQLRQGRHKEAVGHFKESLRLDPNEEYAREGLLESLRAWFPPYRWIIQFYSWLNRFPPGMQWAIVIGLWVVVRGLRAAARQNPAIAPFVMPIVLVFGLFVWLSWIGEPLINVTLLLHPLGRLALPRRERFESYAIATFIVTGILMAVLSGFNVVNLWLGVAIAAVTVVLMSLATRIKSVEPLRVGLFWGLATLGAVGVAAILLVTML